MYIFEQVSVHVLKQNYFLACSWLEVSQISNTFEQLGFKLEMNSWGVEICGKSWKIECIFKKTFRHK